MEAIRSFIAFDIPSFAREIITKVQSRWKSLGLGIKWVQPDNIHLTLKFLGAVPPGQLSEIKKRMAISLSATPTFPVNLEGVGVFPNFKKPRVVWVGLNDPGGSLPLLQQTIEAGLVDLGFPRENRPFSPHLTLGRIKSPQECKGLGEAVESAGEIRSSPFEVDSVKLYHSELTRKGPVYTVLEEFALSARDMS